VLLNDGTYKVLKSLAMIWLPALASLYFGLAQIWHLPKAEEIVGSITLLDTFLGVVLGISSKSYNQSDARFDGEFAVENNEDGSQLRLKNVDTDALVSKDQLTFKLTGNK
jgi:Putative phage holin Dp-1